MSLEDRNFLMTRADLEVAQKRLIAAKSTLKEIVNEYPGDLEAALRLAKVHGSLGEIDDAKQLLLSNLAQAPWHSQSRELLQEIERKELRPSPDIPWGGRLVIAGVLIVVAFLLFDWVVDENRKPAKAPFDTELTCTIPRAEVDATTEGGGASPKADSAGSVALTLGDLTVEIRSQVTPTLTPVGSPTATAVPTMTPTATATPIEGEAQTSTASPTATPPKQFIGQTCNEAIATSAKVTIKDPGGGLKDIPTGFLTILAALGAAAFVILLLPYIKSFEAGGIKLELTAPSEPAKQPPAEPAPGSGG